MSWTRWDRQAWDVPSPGFEQLETRLLLSAQLLHGAGSGPDAAVVQQVPLLTILIKENDALEDVVSGLGAANNFHPLHNADYYASVMTGTGSAYQDRTSSTINFASGVAGQQGRFTGDAAFPDGGGGNFAIRAKATIDVAPGQAGTWTFGVNSDDGSRLKVDGFPVIEDDSLHPPQDSFGSTFLSAGLHEIELLYFEATGGESVELFASPGVKTSFDGTFQLISPTSSQLKVTSSGFKIRQRFSNGTIRSLGEAQAMMDQPDFSLAGYYDEVSGGLLKFVPATLGDQSGAADGVVGPVSWPSPRGERGDAFKNRREAIQAADPFFDYSVYDDPANGGDGDGRVETNELFIVIVAADKDANERRAVFADRKNYDQITRSTAVDSMTGLNYVRVTGRNKQTSNTELIETRYEAFDYPGRDEWPGSTWMDHAKRVDLPRTPVSYSWRNGAGGNSRAFDIPQYKTDDGTIMPGWGQAGNLSAPGSGVVNNYLAVGEWFNWAGLLVHEVGHQVLLPNSLNTDLYNYYIGVNPPNKDETLSQWDPMASTSDKGESTHFSPWQKIQAGWADPQVVTQSGYYTLTDVETTGDMLRINNPARSGEYFVVENRWRGSSYDAGRLWKIPQDDLGGTAVRNLPGPRGIADEGIAIYHVDEGRTSDLFNFPAVVTKENADGTLTGSPTNDLWQQGEVFGPDSMRNSNWNSATAPNVTPSDIVVTPVTAVGQQMTVYVGFHGAVPDRFEPNSQFPFDLGSGDQSHQNLSIHEPNNDDRFIWNSQTGGPLEVDLTFLHADGDIDIQILDASNNVLAFANSSTDNEHVLLSSTTPGTDYFIRIYGYLGATNPTYDLSINGQGVGVPLDKLEINDTPSGAYDLIGGKILIDNLTIDDSTDVDWFKYRAFGAGVVQFEIEFSDALGDLDLQIYDSTAQTVLASSTSTTDDEFIARTMQANEEVLIRVYPHEGDMNSDYRLRIAGDASAVAIPLDQYEANDSIAAATELGTVHNLRLDDLSIHDIPGSEFISENDYFEWIADQSGIATVEIEFDHCLGNVDLYLLNDLGGTIASSTSTTDDESLNFRAVEGRTYYIRVTGVTGTDNAAYDLIINAPGDGAHSPEGDPGGDRASAFNLGNTDVELGPLRIDAFDDDWFEWVSPASGDAIFNINFVDDEGDIDVELYDANGNFLLRAQSSTDNEVINYNAAAGERLFLRVYGYLGATNARYELSIDAPLVFGDVDETNDDPGSATPLPGVAPTGVTGRTIHTPDDEDWYEWVAPATGGLAVDFAAAGGIGSVELYDASAQWLGLIAATGQPRTVQRVEAGRTYLLRVDSVLDSVIPSYDLGLRLVAAGDVDGDGDVDTGDITTIIQNFTGAGAQLNVGWSNGNFDGDGDVDTGDVTTAIQNFTGALSEIDPAWFELLN